MSAVNMDKWVSGEVETFFAPQQAAPTPVIADSNSGEETSTAQFELRADQPPVVPASGGYDPSMVVGAAVAFIASIAAAALIFIVIWARPTAAPTPSPAAAEKPAAPVQTPTVEPIPDQLRSDAGLDRIHRDMARWFDQVTKATPAPQRKPPPPRHASRRHHWPPVRARADRGEAARLMEAELRQMGIPPARRHK
jgi:hypothetical protein